MANTGLQVTLKAAATLDGKIATKTGQSQWVTGPDARRAGHQLRNEHDAILVGINTIFADDPQLTTREVSGGKSPIRVVLDSQGRISLKNACLQNDGTDCIVVLGSQCPESRIQTLKKDHIHILKAPTPQPEIKWLLKQLSQYKIERLLVEGGSQVHASFIKEGCANHLVLFLAGKLLGGQDALSWCGELDCFQLKDAPPLKIQSIRMVGDDVMICADFLRETYA
ncbi:MAG: dihydrofolate reductase family protein [SAR324 cluster bacterium]|nr:dihydrofolate reductase family protein [SAR324 cluster bacterium]